MTNEREGTEEVRIILYQRVDGKGNNEHHSYYVRVYALDVQTANAVFKRLTKKHKTPRRCCTYLHIRAYTAPHRPQSTIRRVHNETEPRARGKYIYIWILLKNYRAVITTSYLVSRAEQRTPATRGLLHSSKMLKYTPWQYKVVIVRPWLPFYAVMPIVVITGMREIETGVSPPRQTPPSYISATERRFRYYAAVYASTKK